LIAVCRLTGATTKRCPGLLNAMYHGNPLPDATPAQFGMIDHDVCEAATLIDSAIAAHVIGRNNRKGFS